MIYEVSSSSSILNVFLSEIRSVDIQKDPLRFRRNMERVSEILAYELSKTLDYSPKEVETPLGIADVKLPDDSPVLATILRAGLSMHQGLLNYFDGSESAFVSAYRHHISEEEFEIKIEYLASPKIDDKILIISDPMLATGGTLLATIDLLKQKGCKKIIGLFLVASPEGLDRVTKLHPDVELFIAAIDDSLNENGYILPGLGDAGDKIFGTK